MSQSKKIKFKNHRDEMLSARLDFPLQGKPIAWAIFAHCFTCSKNLKAVRHIAQALTSRGFGVMSFDFTGLGQSEGAFEDTTFSTNVDDLKAAAQHMISHDMPPSLLVGHSLGGAAALRVTSELDCIRAVATVGAPFEPRHVAKTFASHHDMIIERGEAVASLAGREFTIKKAFLDDLNKFDPKSYLPKLHAALLVMHSPLDETVNIDNATQIFVNAKHPRSFVSLDKADHLLSEECEARYAGELIAQWSTKYLELAYDEPLDARESEVIVRTAQEHYHTDVMARHHALVVDEPRHVGGTDHGATPYDMVLAGLGSCTSITLRMYADRKEIPLESAIVRLHHEKRTVDGPDGKPIKRDFMTRRVELVGDALTDAQRTRLMQIADRCPVHKTLHQGSQIDTVCEDDWDTTKAP